MNLTRESALETLRRLGFSAHEVELAELIPACEMAWADGHVDPAERFLVEVYADRLVDALTARSGPCPTHGRARSVVNRLLKHRLSPRQRRLALRALEVLCGDSPAARHRMLEWATAVADIAGEPAWHRAEERWHHQLLLAFASPPALTSGASPRPRGARAAGAA